jgi:transposase
MLVQASWALIRKDGVVREKYEKLKVRTGGKRAIVAIARKLLIRMRRIMLDGTQYIPGVVA